MDPVFNSGTELAPIIYQLPCCMFGVLLRALLEEPAGILFLAGFASVIGGFWYLIFRTIYRGLHLSKSNGEKILQY